MVPLNSRYGTLYLLDLYLWYTTPYACIIVYIFWLQELRKIVRVNIARVINYFYKDFKDIYLQP